MSKDLRRNENAWERTIRKQERKLDETNRSKIFGTRLTQAINDSELSIKDIEKETFIDPVVMYNYMKGKSSPKLYNVLLLAKALKIDISELYPL